MLNQVLKGLWKFLKDQLGDNWVYLVIGLFFLLNNGAWWWKRFRYKSSIKRQQQAIQYLEAQNKDKSLTITKLRNDAAIKDLKASDKRAVKKLEDLKTQQKELAAKRKARAAELAIKKKALKGKSIKQLTDIINGEW